MDHTKTLEAPSPEVGGSAAPPKSSHLALAVALGNFLFHYRNWLFPVVFVLLALTSRPLLFGGTPRRDALLDIVGLGLAVVGQALRVAVIGLAYIRRGGKDRRIYADSLVTDGFFGHSRNPLYVGNMLIYLGLFLVLDSVVGYLIGVPLFLIAYLCITLAEEDFLRREFGEVYQDYCRRVPRFVPRFQGLGATMRGMRFDWKRVIRKEYGATFSWMTAALTLLYWESMRNRGVHASQNVLWVVLAVWTIVLAGYLIARRLKKTKRL